MGKELELLDKLRGYIDIKLSGEWCRYMLHGWFAPGFKSFHFTYSRRGEYREVRLGEEKGLAYYECSVSGTTLAEALHELDEFVAKNGYEEFLIYDPNIHHEEASS